MASNPSILSLSLDAHPPELEARDHELKKMETKENEIGEGGGNGGSAAGGGARARLRTRFV